MLCLGNYGRGQDILESLPWDAQKRLHWSDFKGSVPGGDHNAAVTASGISYRYTANVQHHEVKLDFKVQAFFYPNESWYNPERCNDRVLNHEQLHFDITELFARRMRKRLEATSFTTNLKEEIKEIYSETLRDLKDFQNQYDRETDFSRNAGEQEEWNKKISEALEL